MHILYSVYVGPYIECKIKKKLTTIIQAGDEIEVEIAEPDGSLLDDAAFLEVFQPLIGTFIESTQWRRGIDVWLPNWSGSHGFEFDPRDEMDIRQLNPADLRFDARKTKAQLENNFELRDQWLKLCNFYGSENVKILWGVINTAN